MTMQVARTPLKYFNFVSGGLRFSTLAEVWGGNSGGKSTFCYQTCGYFLEDFPKGKVITLDTESSFEDIRMKHVFGLDRKDRRHEIIPCKNLEDGFFSLEQILKDVKTETIIHWDTLSAAPTRGSLKNSLEAKSSDDLTMYSGGMQDRPRIIKHHLRNVMSMIYDKPVIVLLPNQVFASLSMYGAGEVAGEGSALKHDRHYSFHVKGKGKKNEKTDEGTGMLQSMVSSVSLVKSKFCPRITDMPMFIDVHQGGKIDEDHSLMLAAFQYGFIQDTGRGWYTINHPKFKETKSRWADLVKNKDNFLEDLSKMMKGRILQSYLLSKLIYQELGRGKEVEECLKVVEDLDKQGIKNEPKKKEAKTKGK